MKISVWAPYVQRLYREKMASTSRKKKNQPEFSKTQPNKIPLS